MVPDRNRNGADEPLRRARFSASSPLNDGNEKSDKIRSNSSLSRALINSSFEATRRILQSGHSSAMRMPISSASAGLSSRWRSRRDGTNGTLDNIGFLI